MFVRTKEGKIFDCLVHEQMGKPIYYPKTSETNGYIDWNEAYKKSENIIDILEVGDYVNGYKVLFIDKDLSKTKNIKCIDNSEERQCFYEKDIKSIVTHEMFESISYEVSK